MKTGINHLYIPGPTNVPEVVRQAMNVPMQDMRAHDFGAQWLSLFTDLKAIMRTMDGTAMLLPGSGTAAWEAAMTNTLNPGDRVLMARHGQFSTLWVEMAQRLGLDVVVVDAEWGTGTPVAEFARHLAADKDGLIKGVFATHNETATGVTSDIAAVRAAMNASFHTALLFVDAVSSFGSIDVRMDDWGVDLLVAGSQKGLMCPAGLGVLGISPKAMAASKTATLRRAYFEFKDMVAMNAGGYFPYTPPTQLLHGMRAALDRINAEGLDNVLARHARLATGVRRAVAAWGLDLVAQHPIQYSNTVSAIRVPEGVDARDVIRIAASGTLAI
jgi:alanine-glyoxylate transaminase / serine-glyoxylate transaminase / serine-pyruvate transaminase